MADKPSASLDRREIFKLGLLAAAAGLAPAPAIAQDQSPRPLPEPTWNVVVDIPGAPEASRATFALEIDPVEIDVEAHGPDAGPNAGLRVYGPGAAHWGSASFTSACTLGGSKELHSWFNNAAVGKNIRKNITVTLFKSDKSASRSYSLMDCFPTQWSAVTFDTSSSVQTETLTVKVGRIEFKT